MNNYSVLFLALLAASCATNTSTNSLAQKSATKPVSDRDLSIALMAFAEGISETGTKSDLLTAYSAGKKKLGPNPFPQSKHYHTESDIEHTHSNPSFKHDPMSVSLGSHHLHYFDHSHAKITHNHFMSIPTKHDHRNK